jgi:hypothetical protein
VNGLPDAIPGSGLRLADRLRDVAGSVGPDVARLVIVQGDPAAGTVRACHQLLAHRRERWRIWAPAGAAELAAGLPGGPTPQVGPGVTIWLEDLDRFVLPTDPELAEAVAAGLRSVLHGSAGGPVLVLATLREDPQLWHRLAHVPASGGADPLVQLRVLLGLAMVVTPDPEVAPAGVPARPVPEWDVAAPAAPSAPAGVPAEADPSRTAPQPSVGGWGTAPAPASADGPDRLPAAERPEPRPFPVLRTSTHPVPPPYRPTPVSPSAPAAPPAPLLRDQGIQRDQGIPPEPASPDEPGQPDEPGESPVRNGSPPAALSGPDWAPVAQPLPIDIPEPAQAATQRALLRELAGNLAGAERLYERAAIAGDLDALVGLARLRGQAADAAEVARYVEQAVAERNTAVLFGLAAAGHDQALRALGRLRDVADAKLNPPAPTPGRDLGDADPGSAARHAPPRGESR